MLISQLVEILSRFLLRNIKNTRLSITDYVLYKIVDSYVDAGKEYLQVQCINTKAIISYTFAEIIYDIDILHGLHPIQGCFIGIEYGRILRSTQDPLIQQKKLLTQCSSRRYGNNNLLYQDRHGLIAFESNSGSKKEVLLMDPRDIALSSEIVSEFDASQAFFIGLNAGLKLAIPKESKRIAKRHLRLVHSRTA